MFFVKYLWCSLALLWNLKISKSWNSLDFQLLTESRKTIVNISRFFIIIQHLWYILLRFWKITSWESKARRDFTISGSTTLWHQDIWLKYPEFFSTESTRISGMSESPVFITIDVNLNMSDDVVADNWNKYNSTQWWID